MIISRVGSRIETLTRKWVVWQWCDWCRWDLVQRAQNLQQDWYPYGHRWLLRNRVAIQSRDVALATNFCLFNPHIFRNSDQCVIKYVHWATMRSTVVGVTHKVDRRRVLLTTSIHRRLAVACHCKPISASSIHRIGFACDVIRQEVQVLRGTQANQLTDQLTTRGIAGWATVMLASYSVHVLCQCDVSDLLQRYVSFSSKRVHNTCNWWQW